MSNIDRNRGCIIRISPEGYRVVMYVDTPGVYFDEKAQRVDRKIAEASGFDTVQDRKDYAKLKLRKNYERQIGAKFAAMEQRLEDILEHNPNVLNDMEVKEVAPGQYAVVVGDQALTDTTLTQEEAITLYTGLTGDDFVSDAEDPPDQVNPFMDMSPKEIRSLLKEAEVKVPVGLRMPKLAVFAFGEITLEDDDSEADDSESEAETADHTDLL